MLVPTAVSSNLGSLLPAVDRRQVGGHSRLLAIQNRARRLQRHRLHHCIVASIGGREPTYTNGRHP